MHPTACNYDEPATEDDGSCNFPIPGFGCQGEVLCEGLNFIQASTDQVSPGDSVVLTIPAAFSQVIYSFDLEVSPGTEHVIPQLSPYNNFDLRVSGTYDHVTNNSYGALDAAFYPGGQPAAHWQFQNEYIRPTPDIFNPDHVYHYDVGWDQPNTILFTGASGSNAESYGHLTFEVLSLDSITVNWDDDVTGASYTFWPEESTEISAVINHGGVMCLATILIEVGTSGCMDAAACNFEPNALISINETCEYPEDLYTCSGECICDSDNDGICDGLEVEGCADENACNYSADVTEHTPGFCIYPEAMGGNCLADVDQDGICDEDEVIGCGEPAACNYLGTTTEHIDELCVYAEAFYNCEGECLADEDNDGVCDQLEEAECENLAIDSIWTNLESGVYPTVNEIQLGIETELSFAFSLAAISTDLESGQSFSNISFEVDSIENRPNWLSCDVAGLIINPEEPVCLGCGLSFDTGVFDLSLSGNLTVSVLGSPFELGEYSFPFQIIVQENNDPILGCDYTMALNYLPVATVGDGSCIFEGCMDPLASNFNALANTEGDCEYFVSDSCPKDLDGDGLVGVSDLLSLLSDYGAVCE